MIDKNKPKPKAKPSQTKAKPKTKPRTKAKPKPKVTDNKKTGRPKKVIDIEQFEKLCGLQCTKEEIASFFNCSEDTIENFCKREYDDTFSAVFNKKRGIGKISLRRNQWKLSEKSPAMAIFLGKQYLNQTDKVMNITPDEEIDPLSRAFEELMNGNNSVQQKTTADTGISEE